MLIAYKQTVRTLRTILLREIEKMGLKLRGTSSSSNIFVITSSKKSVELGRGEENGRS